MGQDIIICNLLTEDKSKVLRNTSIGRKRKLSLYRSKKDVQNIKQRKQLNISTESITPNYTKIQDANSTIDVDILNESIDENKEEFVESMRIKRNLLSLILGMISVRRAMYQNQQVIQILKT